MVEGTTNHHYHQCTKNCYRLSMFNVKFKSVDMLVKEDTRSQPSSFANSLKVVLSLVFVLLFGLKSIIEGSDETCSTPISRCGCSANSFTFQSINKALY